MTFSALFSSDPNADPAIFTVIHDEIYLTTRIRKINSIVKFSHHIIVFL